MANRHFGNLGDVWKHLVLAETLALERPLAYWETHAGSAAYALTHSPARDYGVYRVLDAGGDVPLLARSRYWRELRRLEHEVPSPVYPGSSLLAMRVLGDAAGYLLCDRDPASARSLAGAANALGLGARAECATADGLATVRDRARRYDGDPRDVLVHVDPFDPHESADGAPSAVSLAHELIERGFQVLYWYGYDAPAERAWPWSTVRPAGGPCWCGDLVVRANLAAGGAPGPARLSDVSPLIGTGVLAANLGPATTEVLAELGAALASLYRDATLPGDDTPGAGALDLFVMTT